MTDNNIIFEQLNYKFWFVLVGAKRHNIVRYELWAMPKDKINSLKRARGEATEIADRILDDICDTDNESGNIWYNFAWTLEELGEIVALENNVHFYMRTSEQDIVAVRELITSLQH